MGLQIRVLRKKVKEPGGRINLVLHTCIIQKKAYISIFFNVDAPSLCSESLVEVDRLTGKVEGQGGSTE
jgi:hypothetical protein